jgi:hypothetical protein
MNRTDADIAKKHFNECGRRSSFGRDRSGFRRLAGLGSTLQRLPFPGETGADADRLTLIDGYMVRGKTCIDTAAGCTCSDIEAAGFGDQEGAKHACVAVLHAAANRHVV